MDKYMTNRKDGYYWVKIYNQWVIAKWYSIHDCWGVIDINNTLEDEDFEKINERKIINPNE